MRFGDFEIRPVTQIDGTIRPDWYELIKWYKSKEPMEVTDGRTGEKRMQDTFCFVVAFLSIGKDNEWEFRSVGLRYLENRIEGLDEYILAYCKLIETCRRDVKSKRS